jgi:hypothetical protein
MALLDFVYHDKHFLPEMMACNATAGHELDERASRRTGRNLVEASAARQDPRQTASPSTQC